MRRFSRYLPPAPPMRVVPLGQVAAVLVLILLVLALLSLPALVIVSGVIVLGVIGSVVLERRMRRLAQSRAEEDLCTFARTFDCRVVDPWIIRAVYEEVQACLGQNLQPFPMRATDRLAEAFGIVDEDLDELATAAAGRAGRSLDRPEKNPVKRVDTVGDLVHFLNHQPRQTAAEQVAAGDVRPGSPPE